MNAIIEAYQNDEIPEKAIVDLIYSIRGERVMLDKDLATLYELETKVMNQAVKRNSERFPEEFMFQLTEDENKALRSQFVTLEKSRGAHSKYLPYVFTEQGVAMLSAVLKTPRAVNASIYIMKAFTAFRNVIMTNANIFDRVDNLEIKLLDTDRKVDEVLNAMNNKELDQGIFFKGQLFDAYALVSDIMRSVDRSLVLIDNYFDETVLTLISKCKSQVEIELITPKITQTLKADIEKYQKQYHKIHLKENREFHDRFLIVDGETVYHFGASFKDLGKKCFAMNKLDEKVSELLIDHLHKIRKSNE